MRIAILTFFVLFSQILLAQNDTTATKGEILDGEVIIEKEKKITLPKADKVFKKAVLKSFNSDPLNLNFEVIKPTFNWPTYKSDVPFQNVDKEYPLAEYQSYIRAGFGNYSSPLLEAAVFQQVGKIKISSGLIYESFASGPVNEELSSSSNIGFDLSATYQGKGFAITPYFRITNQQFKFYGNTDHKNSGFSTEEPDQGIFNRLVFGSRLSGAKKGFNYSIDAQINNASQKINEGSPVNKEPSVQAQGKLSVKIDTAFTAGLELEAYSSNYQSGLSYNRSLFKLSPWVRHAKNDLIITAGFRVASSTSLNTNLSGFYPSISIEWKFNPDWSVYVLADGGIDWNNLDQLLTSNQFLNDSLIIRNTEAKLSIGGGIAGTLAKNLKVDFGINGSSLNNLPLYIPAESDSSRFAIMYDIEEIEIITLKMSAIYSPNSTSSYGANVELFNYSMNTIEKPWHLPNFQMELYSSHNINQKLIFSTKIISLFGINTPSDTSFGFDELPAVFDVNVGLKYLITKRSSVFIDVNNLLDKEYERYAGYPVRGLTFKVGGKYRF